MNRLHTEFHRLFQPAEAAPGDTAALVDAHGHTRSAVLEVGRPADWEPIAAVWAGVQADLGLPAPAIAVSGRDALQLWFSLAQPVDIATAQAFLGRLCQRYLPGLPAHRLRSLPASEPLRHAEPVPAEQSEGGRWSAFVAPDLAPLFAQTPWLDGPPGDAAQARILAGVGSISPAQVAAVLAPPAHGHRPGHGHEAGSAVEPDGAAPAPSATRADPVPATVPVARRQATSPRAFLQAVMADEQAPLAVRVQAAAALLPWTEDRAGPTGAEPPVSAA